MSIRGKAKYIIGGAAVCLLLFGVLYLWDYRNSYVESDYFFNYFRFASRGSVLESPNPYLDKLKLEEVNFFRDRVTSIRLPINCQIDYYLKIPKAGGLKISFKHYGPQRTKALQEFKVSIQEENQPAEPLFTCKFNKGFIDNKWKNEEISLTPYNDRIVKLSFNIVKYGSVSKHPEGLLLRPLLMINRRLLKSQAKEASFEGLRVSRTKLSQTNIIMIVLDAARSDHFGCYGYHRPTTPHIDHLAQEGVVFKNSFAVAPFTIASTTSLFTSLYPYTHRVTRWQKKIPENLTTMAEILRQYGYDTYASGFIMRWANRGFKESFDLFINTRESLESSLYAFLKKKFADKKAKTPVFIYIHLRPPHADYDPPEEFDKWSDEEKRIRYAELTRSPVLIEMDRGIKPISQEVLQFLIDKYDGNLLWGDWLVNLILEGFKKFGLFENSLIILSSDHGEAFLEHGKLLHNSTVYNEMIKVPLIMKFPSYIKPKNRLINAYVENIDIMPTVLNLLKIEPLNRTIQGKSLLPVIFGNAKQVKPYLFARAFWDGVYSICDSQYKYIQMFKRGELYHLESDPGEKLDLASSKPILFGYYKSLASFYRREMIRAQIEKPAEAKLDEETKRKLRSLGYLQ